MKITNLLALVAILTATLAPAAYAAIQGAPFIPEIDARFNCLESGYCPTGGSYAPPGFVSGTTAFTSLFNPAGGTVGNIGLSYWKADVAMAHVVGTYNTTIVLPAKTIIKQAWIYTKTQIVGATSTIAFQCVAANDILTATDETGKAADSIYAGTEVGTAATMLYSAAGCTVKLVVGTATITAGEAFLFLETIPAQ